MVIGSLGQVPLTMLAKEMDFRKRLLPDIVPEVVKDTVTIVLALKGFGVWSLVYGQLVDITLTAALAWVVAPLRPRPRIHLSVAREMFAYGKHIQASQILIYFITNLDNMFVSRLRGADDLGVYSQAFTLSNTPATHITRVLGQVMFPALSRVSASMADVRRVFLRAVKYTAMVSIPLSIAIFVFTPPFMDILYGAKWKNAIVPMQLLVIYGGIRSIAANMGPVFKAGGKPQWLVGIATWRLATMLILLYPVTVRYGIVGVSALSAAVAVADLIISATLVNRIISTKMADFVRILSPFLGLSVLSAAIARAVYWALGGIYPPLALLIAAFSMVLVYGVLVWHVDSEARNRIVGLLSEKPVGKLLLRVLHIQALPATVADEL
jgi:O-antigen/teichoic acid export membrane protein